MAFLDVTKAYDKAWSEAIMYVMHKQVIKDKHWRMIKKLNENLTAEITTKYGETAKDKEVLSVLDYGVGIQIEINKDIQNEPVGIEIEENNTRISCLLWVDDVVLIKIPGRTTKNAGHNKPNYQEIPHRIQKNQKQHNEKRRTKH